MKQGSRKVRVKEVFTWFCMITVTMRNFIKDNDYIYHYLITFIIIAEEITKITAPNNLIGFTGISDFVIL